MYIKGTKTSLLIASKYTIEHTEFDVLDAIISIYSVGNTTAKISGTNHILYLDFDDVESNGIHHMLTSQAVKVANFVFKFIKEEVPFLVVQCEAGISRSAGVAAAIIKYYNNDDSEIFKQYHPNTHCYKLVLSSLRKDGLYG